MTKRRKAISFEAVEGEVLRGGTLFFDYLSVLVGYDRLIQLRTFKGQTKDLVDVMADSSPSTSSLPALLLI